MAGDTLPEARIGIGAQSAQRPGGVATARQSLRSLGEEARIAAHLQGGAKDDGGVAGAPLLLELVSALEQDLPEQILVFGGGDLLLELASELERLLRSPFGPRPGNAVR